VRAIHPGGVSVFVTQRIRGFIPCIHLAEVLLKHPEKIFIPGKKLKCKVTATVYVICIACNNNNGSSSSTGKKFFKGMEMLRRTPASSP